MIINGSISLKELPYVAMEYKARVSHSKNKYHVELNLAGHKSYALPYDPSV